MFQPTLFGAGEPAADGSFAALRRHRLDGRSWVDVTPGWLDGADTLFADLVGGVPWEQRDRWMYDRRVTEPRLVCGWAVPDAPDPLGHLAGLLSAHYGPAFDTVFCNYYRSGDDSVAWHGDRVRHTLTEPVVAIVSLGSPRRFGQRPRGGGPGRWFTVAGGDLLVMGGRNQHDWEHTVPKTTRGGPRISVTYRHGAGVEP